MIAGDESPTTGVGEAEVPVPKMARERRVKRWVSCILSVLKTATSLSSSCFVIVGGRFEVVKNRASTTIKRGRARLYRHH